MSVRVVDVHPDRVGTDSGSFLIAQPKEEEPDVMPPARDKTSIPNWLMPALCSILLILLGFVYTTVDRRIEDKQREIEKLERRLDTQETFMKNTREQLIANGWQVDDLGNIKAPARKK